MTVFSVRYDHFRIEVFYPRALPLCNQLFSCSGSKRTFPQPIPWNRDALDHSSDSQFSKHPSYQVTSVTPTSTDVDYGVEALFHSVRL